MKLGESVLILPSCALEEMHLGELAGVTAKIIDTGDLSRGETGYWVELPKPYLGEKEWFIPLSSIIE